MSRERVYLKVPFAQKEDAKRLGARWDQESKRWFVSGDRDLPLLGGGSRQDTALTRHQVRVRWLLLR